MKTLKPFAKSLPASRLKMSLCDKNPEIAQTLARVFQDADNVEVIAGDIFKLSGDALISPANSFGDMGGGLDKRIDDFFKGEAQKKVQASILDNYFGEMPVGTGIIIPMESRQFPYLLLAPTMRIPGNVSKSINAYQAMRAILTTVLKYNQHNEQVIHKFVIPSLCTGVGGMPYLEAAEQMFTAYQQIESGNWRNVFHPALAPYALGPRWIQQ